MIRTLVTAVLLAAVWIAWSWHFEPLVVGFGVFAVVATLFLARRLEVLDVEAVPFELTGRLLLYVPWLIWQVIVANFQTAKIILSPSLPIRPHLIRVRADQRTAVGKVIYANTITITPGTLALDLRDGVILVHCLDDEMASQEATGDVARKVAWLESGVEQDAAPADEVDP